MTMIGIQLDDTTHDIRMRNNRIAIGDTDEQNQYLILACHPGEIKEHPTLGVGIGDYTNDNDLTALRHSVRVNFDADGLELDSLTVGETAIDIKAHYKTLK